MGPKHLRIHGQGFLCRLPGVLEVLEITIGPGQKDMRLGDGPLSGELFEQRHRLFQLPVLKVCRAEEKQVLGIVRIQDQQGLELEDRFAELPSGGQGLGQQSTGLGVTEVLTDDLAQHQDGLVGLAGADVDAAERQARTARLHRRAHGGLVGRLGTGPVVVRHRQGAQQQPTLQQGDAIVAFGELWLLPRNCLLRRNHRLDHGRCRI